VLDRKRDDEIQVSPHGTFGECIVCGVDRSCLSFALRDSDSFRRRVRPSGPIVSVFTDRQIRLREKLQIYPATSALVVPVTCYLIHYAPKIAVVLAIIESLETNVTCALSLDSLPVLLPDTQAQREYAKATDNQKHFFHVLPHSQSCALWAGGPDVSS